MRIQYIDKLKGLAIILVVMGHIAEKSIGIKDSVFNLFYGSFHMPLFMFLSGIFAYKSFKRYSINESLIFLKKKALRILLPFLVVGGIYSYMNYSDVTSVWLGTTCSSYWFLPALFLCMLLGLIINMVPLKGKVSYFLVLIAVYGIFSAMYYLGGVRFPYFLHALKMFPFFILGALCSRYKQLGQLMIKSQSVYAISVMAYFILLYYNGSLPNAYNWPGIFAIVMLVQLFEKYDEKIPMWLSQIGRHSLEIYVFHWFFLPNIPWVSEYILQTRSEAVLNNMNFIPLLVLCLLLAFPIIVFCIGIANLIRNSRLLDIVFFGNLKGKNPERHF